MSNAPRNEAYEQALSSLRRNVHPMGFTAASTSDNVLTDTAENYAAIWARDSMITSLWVLESGEPDLLDTARRSIETLAEHQAPAGQIPAHVLIHNGTPEFSGLGGIASVDSSLWFVIGLTRYAFASGDLEFARRLAPAAWLTIRWLRAHDSTGDGLIQIPESSDWMDLFPRSYNVLYDEVLWHQALRDHASLLDLLELPGGDDERAQADRVRDRIREVFWPVDHHTDMAKGALGRSFIGTPQYLISEVKPFDFSWRCDVYANLLAGLNGFLEDWQKERIFQFIWGVGADDPHPIRNIYPPIYPGDDDWRDYLVVNFLNLPHHYHNGGAWPFIGGIWVRFLHQLGHEELAFDALARLTEANRLGVHQEWEFNEWLHGRSGRPMGKAHQAWSAASYIKAYNALHGRASTEEFPHLDVAATRRAAEERPTG
ncbi:MAG: hypothetical protein O3A10_02125 [Chloroflexi bacterium]|nr:hypothetical protein [Chloroflexota bacterium]MDA1145297.1 hypothetical protein [Chloroflexota bacterium]